MRVMIYHSSIQCSSGFCAVWRCVLSPSFIRCCPFYHQPLRLSNAASATSAFLSISGATFSFPSLHRLSVSTIRRLYSLRQHTSFVLNQSNFFYRSRDRTALVRLAVTGIVLRVTVISTRSEREQGRSKMPKRSKRSHGKSLLKWKLKPESTSRKMATMIPKCLRVRQSQHLIPLAIIPRLHRSRSGAKGGRNALGWLRRKLKLEPTLRRLIARLYLFTRQ